MKGAICQSWEPEQTHGHTNERCSWDDQTTRDVTETGTDVKQRKIQMRDAAGQQIIEGCHLLRLGLSRRTHKQEVQLVD